MSSPEFRIEHDFLGDREVPADAYYGIQTLRGKENFHITGMPISREPYFVKAFGYVKKAAAMANRDLGVLDANDRGRDHPCLRPGDRRAKWSSSSLQTLFRVGRAPQPT